MEENAQPLYSDGPSLWVIGSALILAVVVTAVAVRVLVKLSSRINENINAISDKEPALDLDQTTTPAPGQIASLQLD